MEFRILGPLEVWDRGALLPTRGARQRALLAILLLHANEVVASERLIDDLWGDEPPQSAATALRVRVSQLRKGLASTGVDVLVTRAPGYALAVGEEQLDATRFERLLKDGRRQLTDGAAERAASTLADALSLWRGPPLVDFTYEPFAQAEIARLEDLRLTALEERIEADLVLGRHDVLVGELEACIEQHPLRERLRGQLMLALYRAGRQAEALAAYRETRHLLVEELGIEPSPALQRLEKAILVQDAALEPPERARETVAQPPAVTDERPTRRLITVVATRVANGRRAKRYGEAASEVLASHGARVEQGEAGSVVGLFGTDAVREDDARRAVRAALALRERAEGRGRIGVSTGELVVGARQAPLEKQDGPLAAAVRLSRVAAPTEIVIDEVTRQLVRDDVRLESSGSESSWRVLELLPEPGPLTGVRNTPLVGREFELEQLRVALARAVRGQTSHLFTVLGEPGIGKSRLVHEFVDDLDNEAVALVGRCVSYGEGMTFRPLQEVVAQAAGHVSREAILRLVEDDPDAEAIASRVAAVIGSAEAGGAAEETFWAVRRLLEAIARRKPCVLVLEDLHWAEPTFLDLVDYVAEWTDAPLLLLCLARPELLEQRASWGGGKANATSLMLEPLRRGETEMLVGSLPLGAALSIEARARIVSTAAGNPLFAEQLTASLAEGGRGEPEIAIPPTIQALLAARLDRLGPGERAVLERAALLGTDFWLGGVIELLPQAARPSARRHLEALVRKGLAQRRASAWRGDEDFRFAHDLVQTATYRAMTREVRAELHERYGDWLARTSGVRIGEHAEVVGYHLEQAYHQREQLGDVGEAARRLAGRAAEQLAAAGRRALAREDMAAAANLLMRARALLPAQDPARHKLLPSLAWTLTETGDFDGAEAALTEALEAAIASGDRALRAHAVLGRVELGLPTGAPLRDLQRQAEEAVADFKRLADDQALARALWALAKCHQRRGRNASRREALEHALPHARRAGDEELEADILFHLWWSIAAGPEPIESGQPLLAELQRLADTAGTRFRQSDLLAPLAYLHAIKGDVEASRELVARNSALLADAGLHFAIPVAQLRGLVELLAGDPWAAERAARSGYERAEALGFPDGVVDNAIVLAEALSAQGRFDEAERAAQIARQAAPDDHIQPQIVWQRIRARALAQRGREDDALAHVREAQMLIEQIDDVRWQAATLLDAAEVLHLANRSAEAVAAVEKALRVYERKGDDVSAAKARRQLSELVRET